MARILVTEEIADTGLDRLRDAGHDVDVHLAPSPEQLLELIKGADALIIRSATQVTAELLAGAEDLVVWSAGPVSGSTTSTSTPPPTEG